VRIRFKFDLPKAVQAMAYIVHHLGSVQKVRLTKLLYLADRAHFLKYGWPITGDRLVAMPFGPVPSGCLHALSGELPPDSQEEVYKHIQLTNNEVFLKGEPEFSLLAESERTVLDAVLAEHGSKGPWKLEKETHEYPEYEMHYEEDTSTPIPYESILKVYGDESQYRHNRPVISEAMASHMVCPVARPDPDL
jgi:uncharacterized phage-associated protein